MDPKLNSLSDGTVALLALVRQAGQYVRQLNACVRKLIGSKSYDPETVHKIRVLTRKAGVAWKVLHHAGADLTRRTTRRYLRSLRRSLGPLRDADIRLSHLQNNLPEHKSGSHDELTGALKQDWLMQFRTVHAAFEENGAWHQDALEEMDHQLENIESWSMKHSWRKRDRRWFTVQITRWTSLVDNETDDPQQLHAFRIETKRLRYLMLCLMPKKASQVVQAWLNQLEQLQDLLGTHRDQEIIMVWLDQFQQDLGRRPEESTRLTACINGWRRSCQKAQQQQEKQIVKLRSQLTRDWKT